MIQKLKEKDLIQKQLEILVTTTAAMGNTIKIIIIKKISTKIHFQMSITLILVKTS